MWRTHRRINCCRRSKNINDARRWVRLSIATNIRFSRTRLTLCALRCFTRPAVNSIGTSIDSSIDRSNNRFNSLFFYSLANRPSHRSIKPLELVCWNRSTKEYRYCASDRCNQNSVVNRFALKNFHLIVYPTKPYISTYTETQAKFVSCRTLLRSNKIKTKFNQTFVVWWRFFLFVVGLTTF